MIVHQSRMVVNSSKEPGCVSLLWRGWPCIPWCPICIAPDAFHRVKRTLAVLVFGIDEDKPRAARAAPVAPQVSTAPELLVQMDGPGIDDSRHRTETRLRNTSGPWAPRLIAALTRGRFNDCLLKRRGAVDGTGGWRVRALLPTPSYASQNWEMPRA
jgi:hypothetical protein